jgi:transcriptional regulator with PAS, ATPase and Fis domain
MDEPTREPERRKAFRRTLDEQLDFIQSVLDSMSEPITVINEQNQLICLNQAASKLLPADSSGVKPLICHMCNHGKENPCTEPESPCPMKKAKESGQSVSVVHEHRLPNGGTRTYEIIAVPLLSRDGAFQGIVESLRDVTERRKTEQEKEQLIIDLRQALSRVKALSGLLPICASCKKIRNDTGYWEQIEAYISEHSEAEFSHGICPDCARKLYAKYSLEET